MDFEFEIENLSKVLIRCYAKSDIDCLQLSIDDIPEWELARFASLLIDKHGWESDPFCTMEFQEKLIIILNHEDNNEVDIDFSKMVKAHIVKYYKKTIEDIIFSYLPDVCHETFVETKL